MKLLRTKPDCERAPSIWWGFCWHDHERYASVIAPIGLNVIFAFARWCWQWVAYRATAWLAKHDAPIRRT